MIVEPSFTSVATWPVLGDGATPPHFGLLQTHLLPSPPDDAASRTCTLSKHREPSFPPKITTRLLLPASEDDLSPPMTVALGGEATRKNAGDASFLSDGKHDREGRQSSLNTQRKRRQTYLWYERGRGASPMAFGVLHLQRLVSSTATEFNHLPFFTPPKTTSSLVSGKKQLTCPLRPLGI
jgi:hypothetical protein